MSDQTSADEARQEISGRDEDKRRRPSSTTGYEMHPLCTLFPPMTGAEFAALRDDIKANGLRQMIVLKDGMILDGGNRYRACLEACVTPRFVDYIGENLAAYVLSVNLHRRHMTPGQQAAIVASAQDWAKAQVAGSNQHVAKAGSATLHYHSNPLSSAASRAAESGASLRTQKMADKVVKADPALAVEVGHGKVSLPAAVKLVETKASKKAKKSSPPADTASVATPPEQHDETPGPVKSSKAADLGEVADLMARIADVTAKNAALTDEVELLREVAAGAESSLSDSVLLQAIVDASDPLAESVAMNKRFKAEIDSLNGAVRALQSERNEAVRLCKSHIRQSEKLKKILKGLGHEPD